MIEKLQKNRGITLIALILTIIVLLILAGVAVNMLVGENGILSHTKTSTEKYSIESVKEELRLDILNIQTEILKTEGRTATLEDLKARIDLAKYEIELHYEPIATSTPVVNPATYSIVNRIGTNYYFTVDDKLIITNVEGIIEENSPISKFTIKLSDTTYKETTVTLNEIPTSEAGTIEKYDYVAETTDNKIEIPNITETTKKITGLTEKTTYKVYVIAYDNAGNKRKSNVVTKTTPEYTPPQVISPSTGDGTYRAGNALNFTWAQLSEIAKSISNLAKDKVGADNPNRITEDTNELTIIYEGDTYTIGVGDYTTINGKKVRILGFNHDELVDQEKYGGTNKYAGISFEYVDFISSHRNYSSLDSGGWKLCPLRETLNTTLYNEIKDVVKNIKQVKKAYCTTYNNSALSYSNDYLWLLSCAEIWNTGAVSGGKGYSTGVEGNQYKYYKNINPIYTSKTNSYLKKPSSKTNTSLEGDSYWLRSRLYWDGGYFCYITGWGETQNDRVEITRGVAPGFCI